MEGRRRKGGDASGGGMLPSLASLPHGASTIVGPYGQLDAMLDVLGMLGSPLEIFVRLLIRFSVRQYKAIKYEFRSVVLWFVCQKLDSFYIDRTEEHLTLAALKLKDGAFLNRAILARLDNVREYVRDDPRVRRLESGASENPAAMFQAFAEWRGDKAGTKEWLLSVLWWIRVQTFLRNLVTQPEYAANPELGEQLRREVASAQAAYFERQTGFRFVDGEFFDKFAKLMNVLKDEDALPEEEVEEQPHVDSL